MLKFDLINFKNCNVTHCTGRKNTENKRRYFLVPPAMYLPDLRIFLTSPPPVRSNSGVLWMGRSVGLKVTKQCRYTKTVKFIILLVLGQGLIIICRENTFIFYIFFSYYVMKNLVWVFQDCYIMRGILRNFLYSFIYFADVGLDNFDRCIMFRWPLPWGI